MTGIFSSRSKAREAITSGSISIFGKPNNDPATAFRSQTSISEKYWLVRFGKKKYHLIIQKPQQPQGVSRHMI
jgi:tyrosyl-tRNA synthetase